MSKISKLESRRLLKELEFIESEYEYKSEIINESDITFIKTVNIYLEGNPELKTIIDEKVNIKIENIIKEKQISEVNESVEVVIENKDDVKYKKIKKLYREIAKLTHPDKVDNIKLNDLYIRSTNYYNEGNLIMIYSICSDLNIEYEYDESDNELIIDRIKMLKERITFLESTFAYMWYESDDGKKNDVIMSYIKAQLR